LKSAIGISQLTEDLEEEVVMEKQELIDKWENKTSAPSCEISASSIRPSEYEMYTAGYGVARVEIIEDLKRLDEPQKVRAKLAKHWHEDVGDCLWWNFPVEEPPYCGTPLDEHFPKYKTHFTTIDMPNEIEKPKRWIVKYIPPFVDEFRYYSMDDEIFDITESSWTSDKEDAYPFTEKEKADAAALLVNGTVEEVAEG